MADKPSKLRIAEDEKKWEKRRDIPITILGWIIITILFFWLLNYIKHTILLFIIAAFLAYALFPVVKFVERYVHRAFAISIVYLLLLIIFGSIMYFAITTAILQFIALAHTVNLGLHTKNSFYNSLLLTLHNFGISQQQLFQFSGQLTTQIEKLSGSIVPILSGIFTSILDVLVIVVISIYLLHDGIRIIIWLKNNFPSAHTGKIHFLLNTLQRIVGGYIRGQLLLATIIAFLVTMGMLLFHVPYAVLLGVLAFLLEFIPILGTLISGFICVLLALTQGWFIALLVLLYFIFIHVIEGDILGPRIVGQALGLHPLIAILALIAGSELYGIIGALFASPVAGVLN